MGTCSSKLKVKFLISVCQAINVYVCFIKKGTVMLKVSPFQERSVTQVMCAMVERILELPMMEKQEDLVLKGHSVSQGLLNLILVVLEHTVRALVEQATKTVSCVILDTSVLRSN